MGRQGLRWVIIFVILSAVVVALIYFLSTERSGVIGLSPPTEDWVQEREVTVVTLTFKDFRPSGSQLSGEAKVEIHPRDAHDFPALADHLKQTFLVFEHFETDHYIGQGGGDGPFDLTKPELASELTAKTDFNWAAETLRSAFYYPFDTYSLDFNPMMMDRGSDGIYPSRPVSAVTLDFTNSNFVAEAKETRRKGPEDAFTIHLSRSPLAQIATAIAAALMVIWLGYLVGAKGGVENIGGLLAIFLGVFSIRTTLLSGAPLLPCAIDYACLVVYAGAILIILIKWLLPDVNKKPCPHCASEIALEANVCPFCTRELSVPNYKVTDFKG